MYFGTYREYGTYTLLPTAHSASTLRLATPHLFLHANIPSPRSSSSQRIQFQTEPGSVLPALLYNSQHPLHIPCTGFPKFFNFCGDSFFTILLNLSDKCRWWVFLFVCSFSPQSRIFHSYGDVTIAGEGLHILTCSALRCMAIEQ